MMNELLSKLKRMITEPKVYSLIVTSERAQILYIGVHFSLEEAYGAARQKMEAFAGSRPGEAMDIDLWNTLTARSVLEQILESSETTPKPAQPDPATEPMAILDDTPPFDLLNEILSQRAKERVQPMKKEHSVKEQAQDVRKTRNALMQKLIDDGDLEQIDKLKDVLGVASRRYVRDAIEKKRSIIKEKKDK